MKENEIMSLEAWGDENPADADYDSWADKAADAGWLDPEDYSPGAIAILMERERQEVKEGFTVESDDRYLSEDQLAVAGAAYAIFHHAPTMAKILWPWDELWFKPKSPVRDLVRAGALIAAEIDRRVRAGEKIDE